MLNEQITCNIPLKSAEELEIAIYNLNIIIQKAAWTATLKLYHQNRTKYVQHM